MREVGTGAAGVRRVTTMMCVVSREVHQADYTIVREGRRELESEGHPRKTASERVGAGDNFKVATRAGAADV